MYGTDVFSGLLLLAGMEIFMSLLMLKINSLILIIEGKTSKKRTIGSKKVNDDVSEAKKAKRMDRHNNTKGGRIGRKKVEQFRLAVKSQRRTGRH